MANCDRCGFKMPEGAVFCPNCGSPARRVNEGRVIPADSIANPLRIGLLGTFLSIMMSSLIPYNMYFLPSFISSLAVIYVSKIKGLKDATIITMVTYIFADAVMASIVLGSLYLNKQPLASLYNSYVPTLIDVIMYSMSPVTAVVASYLGVRISPKRREEGLTYHRSEGPNPPIVYNLKRKRAISLQKI